MLGIYAKTFTTATRTGTVTVRDVKPAGAKKRWLPKGHWFLGNTRDIDLNKL